MGIGASEEVPQLPEGVGTSVRERIQYLDWLIDDSERITQAFQSIWHACGSGDVLDRDELLEAVLAFVARVEGVEVSSSGEYAGRTIPQLQRMVAYLPIRIGRQEAQHLFYKSMLAARANLIEELDSGEDQARPSRGEVADPHPPSRHTGAAVPPGEEDQRIADAHLQAELERQRWWHATLEVAWQSELSMVESLTNELNEAEAGQTAHLRQWAPLGWGAAPETMASAPQPQLQPQPVASVVDDVWHHHPLSPISKATEQELATLRKMLEERGAELASKEEQAAAKQRELLRWRAGDAECGVHPLDLEVQTLEMELMSRKTEIVLCETRVAAEETEAAAVREAFEARKSRFFNAEDVAQNSEVGLLTAARRRFAAEATTRREEEALEEAKLEHEAWLVHSESEIEACVAEVEVLRKEAAAKFHSPSSDEIRKDEAHAALRAVFDDLRNSESDYECEARLRDAEKVKCESLEYINDNLRLELRDHESELSAQQRRARRKASGLPTLGSVEQDTLNKRVYVHPKVQRLEAELQKSESVLAGTQLQKAEIDCARKVQETLQKNKYFHASLAESLEDNEASWLQARSLAAQIGEVQAALTRRRAVDRNWSHGEHGEVAEMLRSAIRESEEREASLCDELAEVTRTVAQKFTEHHSLKPKLAQAEEEARAMLRGQEEAAEADNLRDMQQGSDVGEEETSLADILETMRLQVRSLDEFEGPLPFFWGKRPR